MLTCKNLAQVYASDYIDNLLTPGQKRGVRFHLLICGHCRRFVKQLRLVRSIVKHKFALQEPVKTALGEQETQDIVQRIKEFQQKENKSSPHL